MRGHLAGDRKALGLGGAHHVQAAGGAQMLDVQRAAGEAADSDVAGDLDLLALGGPAQKPQARGRGALVDLAGADEALVLAVAHDDAVELLGVVHDAAHHAAVLDAAPVVGERAGAVRDHVAHLGEGLALEALRAGADDLDTALPRLGRAALHVLDDLAVVDGGLGVGHAGDRREAAMRGGAGARGDVLLLLQAGVAQVDVNVDEAGHEDLAGQVALDALGHLEIVSDLHDAAVADEDVADLVEIDLGIDDAGVSKHQCHDRCLLTAGTGPPCAPGRRRRLGRGCWSVRGGLPCSRPARRHG